MLRKKQVEEFQLLVLELNSFLENPDKLEYSDSISPELAGLIGAIGGGAIGVGSVLAAFSGLSGAGIMSGLAAYGVGGAVGGIASVPATVAAPVALAGAGLYYASDQRKMKKKLRELFQFSDDLKMKLWGDTRPNVIDLIKAIDQFRKELEEKM